MNLAGNIDYMFKVCNCGLYAVYNNNYVTYFYSPSFIKSVGPYSSCNPPLLEEYNMWQNVSRL